MTDEDRKRVLTNVNRPVLLYPPHPFTPYRVGLDAVGREPRCSVCGCTKTRCELFYAS